MELHELYSELDKYADDVNAIQKTVKWKFKSGSLSSPFDPALDTSDWRWIDEIAESGEALPTGDAWLCSTLEVPAEYKGIDVRGSKIGVFIHGVLQTELYLDGKLLVEAKTWANGESALMQGNPVGKDGGTYILMLKTNIKNGQSVPSSNLRVNFVIDNINLIAEEIKIIRSELNIANTVSVSSNDHALVKKAASQVDIKAMKANDWVKFKASVKKAERTMMPLSPRVKEHTVHFVGHSHIDMNWFWEWDETVDVIKRDFASVLSMMEDYPDLTFTHSQVPTYKVIMETEPEMFKQIKQRVKEGRWEVAAATWVEGDLNIINGESMSHQLLHAIHWCEEHLGVTPDVCWEPDTFGHSANIPQVLASAGVDSYFHSRCNPFGYHTPVPAYFWEGMDGSSVFAACVTYVSNVSPEGVEYLFREHFTKVGTMDSLFVHGMGDHGGGPARSDMNLIARLKERPLYPTLICSTLSAYTKVIQTQKHKIPVHKGDLNYIFEGCYTSQAGIKSEMRRCENLLLTAETLGALTKTSGHKELHNAWEATLFNQFHDIFDGASIDPIYEQATKDAEYVEEVTAEVTAKAMEAISGKKRKDIKGMMLTVFNPLAWARRDVVKADIAKSEIITPHLTDETGKTVKCQMHDGKLIFIADIPALGKSVYYLSEGNKGIASDIADVQQNNEVFLIDTADYQACVLKNSGIIGSYIDKKSGKELIPYGLTNEGTHTYCSRSDLAFNVIQMIDERHHEMTKWLIDASVREESMLGNAEVEVVSSGDVFTLLRSKTTFRSSSVTQYMFFYKHFDRVDFCTSLDWKEPENRTVGIPDLKIAFTASIQGVKAVYDIPYGVKELAADGQERPAVRWAAADGCDFGIAILNDSKYGYDVLGPRIRLTAVHGAFGQVPDFNYSLLVYSGGWRAAGVNRRAAEFNQPLLSWLNTTAETSGNNVAEQSFEHLVDASSGVLVSAIKQAFDGNGIMIRMYDGNGQGGRVKIKLPSEYGFANLENAPERLIRKLDIGKGFIEIKLRPWEICTVRLY